jgi:hypothetical protein
VAVTPTAQAAPFAGVKLGDPTARLNPGSLEVAWSLRTPRGWTFPGADVATSFALADDPLAIAALPRPPVADAAPMTAPVDPFATVSGGRLHATTPLPSAPGAYVATTTVTDRRFGKVLASSAEIPLFVPGPRRATLRLHVIDGTAVARAPIPVTVSVANTGDVTWADDIQPLGAPTMLVPSRDTRVMAHWIALDVPADGTGADPSADGADTAAAPVSSAVMATQSGPVPAGTPETPAVAMIGDALSSVPASPPAFELGRVALAPGGRVELSGEVPAPETPGTWALVVDVIDEVDGSFAALGSAPAVHVFVVVVARGLAPVD